MGLIRNISQCIYTGSLGTRNLFDLSQRSDQGEVMGCAVAQVFGRWYAESQKVCYR